KLYRCSVVEPCVSNQPAGRKAIYRQPRHTLTRCKDHSPNGRVPSWGGLRKVFLGGIQRA
uniref:Uncharacterized protein n=1 Tax=Anopheles atroparvus TaxID=41427 RepID=A0AAG5DDH0_ANOAO